MQAHHLWLPELVRLALAVPDRDLACAAVAAAQADAAAEPPPMRIYAARRARAILDGDAATLLSTADSAQVLGPLDRGQTYEEVPDGTSGAPTRGFVGTGYAGARGRSADNRRRAGRR